jgi:Glycosyltransferase family 9 (heptosyltransferase)
MLRRRLTYRPGSHFGHPAVIFGNAFGDHLLVLPALRALAALFPGRLSLICMPGMRRRFFSDVPLRSVCEVEMGPRGGRRRFDSTALARRIGKCDLFLSLNPWTSPSLDRLVTLLCPALSIGLSPAFQVVLRHTPRQHVTELAFSVAAYLNPSLQLDDFAFPARLPPRVGRRIRQFLRIVAPGKRVLAIHNETKQEKTWPVDSLSSFVTEFLERHPDFVIFILDCWKPEIEDQKFKHRIIHSRALPLPYAFAVLRESDLFLGADSSMLHAADQFRVPGVGLFAPTDPALWGFRFSPHRHIRDHRGMKYIREAAVLRAIESLLN